MSTLPFSPEEERRIFFLDLKSVGVRLAKFHGIFYKMWSYGKPVLTTKIPTAAAVFDDTGRAYKFMFNPEFWNKLTDYDRAFIVAHECLHVLLNHGQRGMLAFRNGRKDQANVAMDLAVNHMLEDYFGFNRKLLGQEIRDKLVYGETFYPPGTEFATDDSFEQHYVRISKLIQSGKIKEIIVPGLDDHSYLAPNEQGGESHIREVAKELSSSERQKLAEGLKKELGKEAGNEAGLNWLDINASRPRKKRKWEHYVKLWNYNALFNDSDREENFMKTDRRLAYFEKSENFFLPGDNPSYIKVKDRKKVRVYLFLDVSGSCVHLKDYFFEAARTLPPERFEVRGFTFNTEVREVNIYTDKIVGDGGTSFTCIDKYIETNFGNKYPKCVFVFTDGYGDNVAPRYPERWYWFLTDENSQSCIPNNSNVFHLSDFVPNVTKV